jgi:hypothetical protein
VPTDDAPDFSRVSRAASPKARTSNAGVSTRRNDRITGTHFGESCALGNPLYTIYEGTQVSCSNIRISDKFDEIVDNNNRTPLDFHTSVIERTHKKGYEHS